MNEPKWIKVSDKEGWKEAKRPSHVSIRLGAVHLIVPFNDGLKLIDILKHSAEKITWYADMPIKRESVIPDLSISYMTEDDYKALEAAEFFGKSLNDMMKSREAKPPF